MPDTFVADDAVSFEEPLRADANTVRSRKWATDLFASHAALKSAVQELYGDRLKECFGLEADKILDEAFKSIRALVDASGRDESGSLHIRFHCPAWMAQQFKSRELLPKGAGEEERNRLRARLQRQWARNGWRPLRLMQCATGLPFIRRDVVPFNVNYERKAAVYENEYTDLLLETRRRANAFRRKHTVWLYEQAAREVLRAYVTREGFRPYAPNWQPEQKAEPTAAPHPAGDAAEEDEPSVKVESIARRAASRAAKIAAQLPPDEADACAVLFFECLADIWEKETGRVFPPVLPVIRRADNKKPSDSTSYALTQAKVCEFPAKNEDSPHPSQDILSAVEMLEFEAEDEPRGVSMADAEAAATACASVGIEAVKVVFVDDTKPRDAHDGCTLAVELSLSEFQRRLTDYLERNRLSRVESFTVRLRRKENTRLIQIDDCTREVKDSLLPLCFMTYQTSPGNWQVWLCLADHLTGEEYGELRYRILAHLKPTGANGGAYGSTRWPGSLNNKPKRRYPDGEAPRVALSYVAFGRRVSVAELEAAGLLAPPRPKPSGMEIREIKSRIPASGDWPDMDYYLSVKGNRSDAEMAWCVRALCMGYPRASVEAELLRIGEKARVRRQDNYVRETVDNAERWIGLSSRIISNARPAESLRPPARERRML